MSAKEDATPYSTPLILGHRGASAVAPENTLAAFGRALADGADGLEFDVRLAADGLPVVIHDATLERTALRPGRVEALTSEELLNTDAGTWFNRRSPSLARQCFAAERIPSLAQVFERFGREFKALYVEMKCEEPSLFAPLARAVVRTVREHELADRAVVKCFAHEAIREVKSFDPGIRTAALFERGWARPLPSARAIIEQALACGADEISLHHTLARPRVVAAARQRGLDCLVWTVDSPAFLKRAVSLGLKAVITNDPSPMLAGLGRLHGRN